MSGPGEPPTGRTDMSGSAAAARASGSRPAHGTCSPRARRSARRPPQPHRPSPLHDRFLGGADGGRVASVGPEHKPFRPSCRILPGASRPRTRQPSRDVDAAQRHKRQPPRRVPNGSGRRRDVKSCGSQHGSCARQRYLRSRWLRPRCPSSLGTEPGQCRGEGCVSAALERPASAHVKVGTRPVGPRSDQLAFCHSIGERGAPQSSEANDTLAEVVCVLRRR